MLSRLTNPKVCITLSKREWAELFNAMPEGTKFQMNEDEDWDYFTLPYTMVGSVVDLLPTEEQPKRHRFSRRKVQVAVKKRRFGFAQALDKDETNE